MGDSQQGNNKGKGKEKENYESWTMDDTNELLHLLVDAINSGLRDANGSLSKQNVERVILPRLNAKISIATSGTKLVATHCTCAIGRGEF
ncbi:unnamed protein product [Prunus brigantina]